MKGSAVTEESREAGMASVNTDSNPAPSIKMCRISTRRISPRMNADADKIIAEGRL